MKYSLDVLKKQKTGFVFNAQNYLDTILPGGWNEKRLLSIKNNVVEETNLLAQTMGNMKALGVATEDDVRKSINDFAKKYGTGLANTDRSRKLPHGQDLLRNRVEGALLYDNAVKMTETQIGRKFRWLPSGAKEPRHTHMLRYGKIYEVGSGVLPPDDDFPGKAYGCKCSYEWVDEVPSQYSMLDEDNIAHYKYAQRKTLEKEPRSVGTLMRTALIGGDAVRKLFATKADFSKMSRDLRDSYSNPETPAAFADYIKDSGSNDPRVLRQVKNPLNYTKSRGKMTLYRGGSTSHKFKRGEVFYTKDPVFTTLDKDTGELFQHNDKVLYKIQMENGARVLPSMLFSPYGEGETEFLVAPMTTFKVVSVRKVGGVLRVTLRCIPAIGNALSLRL